MKNKNKIFIYSAIFSLAGLAIILFLIAPVFQNIDKNSRKLFSDKESLLLLSEQVKEMDSFQKNYEAYKTSLEKIDALFVDPKNPVEFIKFLEDAASENKIESGISLMQSLSKESKSGQAYLSFQMACEGDFSDIIAFSEKLENGPYLIDIQNLMVKKAESSVQSGKKTAVLSPQKTKAFFLINIITR